MKSIFILIIIATLLWRAHESFLRIKSTSCIYGQDSCPKAVEDIAKSYQAKSIFKLNQINLRSKITQTGYAQDVKSSFYIPGKLKIIVEPASTIYPVTGFFQSQTPRLSFITSTDSAHIVAPSVDIKEFLGSQSGQLLELLQNGQVVESGKKNNIYIISVKPPQSDLLLKVLSWLKTISKSQASFESIFFVDGLVILSPNTPPDIVINIHDNPPEKLSALQEINQVVTIKETKVIDFRHNHPILK